MKDRDGPDDSTHRTLQRTVALAPKEASATFASMDKGCSCIISTIRRIEALGVSLISATAQLRNMVCRTVPYAVCSVKNEPFWRDTFIALL